jgi:uncharacterized phage-associated protein
MASKRPGIDVIHAIKCLFFAEKEHLNRYGRPITGDRYEAWANGPVPQLAYDLIRSRGDRLDPQSLESVRQALHFEGGRRRQMTAKRAPDLMVFSRTDTECMDRAIGRYADLPLEKLARLAHEDPAYRATKRDETIDYESMVDAEGPERAQILSDLRDTAPYVVL